MPKYRNKMRLEEYLNRHGSIDPLARYLMLAGYDDEVVAGGLDDFVADWEEAVEWLNRYRVPAVVEEYGYDLYRRTQLHCVLCHAPLEQCAAYAGRIELADRLFMKGTVELGAPYITFDELLNGHPDPVTHWWLFRVPR